MEINQPRPPFVAFEVRAEEDRTASIEAGHYVAVDVHYAVITPAGSKDKIERRVDEWLEQTSEQVRAGRLPQEWADAYKRAYASWVEGREIPAEGTPIATWPVASPAQIKTLLDIHVRTVEELAIANEETISRLGMGGRALKQRAADWLSAAQPGKVSEELSAVRQEAEGLKVRNESLEEQVRTLQAQVNQLMQAAPNTGKTPAKL